MDNPEPSSVIREGATTISEESTSEANAGGSAQQP